MLPSLVAKGRVLIGWNSVGYKHFYKILLTEIVWNSEHLLCTHNVERGWASSLASPKATDHIEEGSTQWQLPPNSPTCSHPHIEG